MSDTKKNKEKKSEKENTLQYIYTTVKREAKHIYL